MPAILKQASPHPHSDIPLLRHIKPYHERLAHYNEIRAKIFSEVTTLDRVKRNTLRMRNYWHKIRSARKLLVSSVVDTQTDGRLYASITFLGLIEIGLLDTGANISCLGADLAAQDWSSCPNFKKISSRVKTADGSSHQITGFISTDVAYNGLTKRLDFYVIPSINKRVILGIDFWRIFQLAPGIISSIDTSKAMVDGTDTNLKKFPLSSSQEKRLDSVINLFPNYKEQGLGKTSLLSHDIDVGDAKPIKQRFYPVSPAVEKLIYVEVDRMLSEGVIEPSKSPWSSPMRLVIKPGKVRLCLDARRINECTKKDAYPLPNIDGIFSRLPKANIITKLDLKDAFWQIPLTDEAKAITAFTVPGRPLYQFTVMPFGLCNAPQTMCRLVDELIPADLKTCVFGYLDDVCVVSEDFDTHMSILIRLAEQFRRANLTLNVAKSRFCVTEVEYLGDIIGNGGIATDPKKVDAIKTWPSPKTIKQVRSFLGLVGWYRRFISNFSELVFPITEVLSTKKKFLWTDAAETAFQNLKNVITSAPVLQNPDFSKKFFVHCDASDCGVGAVLVQLSHDNVERPVAFMSKKLNTAQRNYSVTERECLAAVLAIEKFRCYLELQEFELITDHASLLWLMRQPNLKGRLARWAMRLQGYRFSVSHRRGSENIVPDALSRMHVEDVSAIELIEPEIDLDSACFDAAGYVQMRNEAETSEGKYPDLKVIGRYLYIRTKHEDGTDLGMQQAWKLWIPKGLTESVIRRAHESVVTAHGGMAKTLELIRRNFYWPGMVSQVRLYVRACDVCKSTKAPNQSLKPPMGKPAISERPFERLYIDILGPYPRSKRGYIGLLIVVDHLSKFHWLCPLKKFNTAPIKEFLQDHIFFTYGVPRCIVSDNGVQFKSSDFNAWLTSLGVKHIYTALYSPQSNASERVNRSLIAGIRAFLSDNHTEWDLHIYSISCALRNAYHQSIGCSPYFALYGFDMATHGKHYDLLKNFHLLGESVNILGRTDQLNLIRKEIKANIAKAYDQNERQYNLRTREISFKVGQEVFRRNFSQSNFSKQLNAKLNPQWLKSRVKAKLGSSYYVLEDLQGREMGTYHTKDIKQ